MFLRLVTEEAWDYILKAEREDYWIKRVADAEKAIVDLQAKPDYDPDVLQEKKDELQNITKSADEAKEYLAKHGPTVWKIKSVTQPVVDRIMKRLNSTVMQTRGKGKDEIKSGQIAYTREMARAICEIGLVGWDNVKNPKTGASILFDKTLIETILPFDATSELSNQISGNVDDEEVKNLS